MKRLVLCCLPAVPCGYGCGADLPFVTEQSLCLGVSVVLLVSLLLIGYYRRSRAGKPDFDVAGGDPLFLMMIRYFEIEYFLYVTDVVFRDFIDSFRNVGGAQTIAARINFQEE